MKVVSNLVIALGFVAASGASLAVDRYEPTAVSSASTLTRAEVRAEAIAARPQERALGYVTDSGYSLNAPHIALSSVTRAEVRAEAIAARSALGSTFNGSN